MDIIYPPYLGHYAFYVNIYNTSFSKLEFIRFPTRPAEGLRKDGDFYPRATLHENIQLTIDTRPSMILLRPIYAAFRRQTWSAQDLDPAFARSQRKRPVLWPQKLPDDHVNIDADSGENVPPAYPQGQLLCA